MKKTAKKKPSKPLLERLMDREKKLAEKWQEISAVRCIGEEKIAKNKLDLELLELRIQIKNLKKKHELEKSD